MMVEGFPRKRFCKGVKEVAYQVQVIDGFGQRQPVGAVGTLNAARKLLAWEKRLGVEAQIIVVNKPMK